MKLLSNYILASSRVLRRFIHSQLQPTSKSKVSCFQMDISNFEEKRPYEDVLEVLNSKIAAVNFRPFGNASDLKHFNIDRVCRYLEIIGINATDVDRLNVIHITGSKGKGSVCAQIASILKSCGYRTGLLSSPHLVNVEERIQVDGKPISRECFTRLFWSVHDVIRDKLQPEVIPMPSFIQYLIVMACKLFVNEKLDAAIFEVGIGGRFDQTNFLRRPVVTAITTIALEHTEILGNTLPEIAYAKSGIFKPGSIALVSAGLPAEVMAVMTREAETVGCPLVVAPSVPDKEEAVNGCHPKEASFDHPPVSLSNVGVSLAAVHLWLQRERFKWDRPGLQPPLGLEINPQHFKVALGTRWPGRWQRVVRDRITYFVDGAHTVESVQATARWFQQHHAENTARILVFTVLGSRNPTPMLSDLMTIVRPAFDLAVFANPHDGPLVALPSKQSAHLLCAQVWHRLQTETGSGSATLGVSVDSLASLFTWLTGLPDFAHQRLASYRHPDGCCYAVSNAVEADPVRRDEVPRVTSCHVLVTGSIYLVGAAFKALKEPV